MSRTFRRKGYEKEAIGWVRGNKVAGYYTENDVTSYKYIDGDYIRYVYIHSYRKPTRQEHNKKYWHLHSESKTSNSWSPSWSYRNMRMKENRMLTKTELFKFMKDTEYEVMVEANPRSCLWDWS